MLPNYKKTEFIRSWFIFGFFCALYLILGIYLYNIQIKQRTFFSTLGDKQYTITVNQTPWRGEIYDRNNNKIALNKESVAAFITPAKMTHKEKTYNFLQKHFPASIKMMNKPQYRHFMYIGRRLTPEQIELIEQAQLPDIYFLHEPSRFYPYPSLSTIVGITDIDNAGSCGIEQQYNTLLAGTPTTYELEQDARNNHFYFKKEIKKQGAHGQPITLTIDAILQSKVDKILVDAMQNLHAKETAAIVINPDNGEIYAMASAPRFDPENTTSVNLEEMRNRVTSLAFETGSVIKIFCALAAFEENVVTLDELIDCQNTKETKIDGIRVRTVLANGVIPFEQVIEESNNIGTVKVAKRIGKKLYDYYKLVGFGKKTPLTFPGEQSGFVNPPDNWSAYSIYSLSYGYEIRTTLLQLARATSLLVNGGYLITPTLIKSDEPAKKVGPLVSEYGLDCVNHILEYAVLQGTGKKAQIPGYTVKGKTGTAMLLENGHYKDGKNLYTFIGCVEKDDYKRVICIYVKESKLESYASVIAAPVFKEIAQATLLHDHQF